MDAERQPELQRAERARVLERAVDGVDVLAVGVRDVALVVGERGLEGVAVADQQHAAGLRHVQPLVRVDGRRVDAVEPVEQVPGERGRRGRQPVGAVDVQPHVARRADVGRAPRGRRRRRSASCPAVATTATGTTPARRSASIAAAQAPRIHAAVGVDAGSTRTLRAADPEHLGGAVDRVVRLGRAVEGEPAAGEPRRGATPGTARSRAAVSAVRLEIVPPAAISAVRSGGEADEVADPADGLALERRRGAGADRDVDVVRGHQRVAEHADLEARAADPGEEARPRLGQRDVEHRGGGVERRAPASAGLAGQRLAQQRDGGARSAAAGRRARRRTSARSRGSAAAACSSTASRSASRQRARGWPAHRAAGAMLSPMALTGRAGASDQLAVASVVDLAYAAIRERIVSGALPRGARVHQEDLAVELGVSRTPVREALRRLAAEGLVEMRTNRGARVADLDRSGMRAAYEARLVIEPGAPGSPRRGAPEHAAARDGATRWRASAGPAAGASTRGFEANRDFHLALVGAAGNAVPRPAGAGCCGSRGSARRSTRRRRQTR